MIEVALEIRPDLAADIGPAFAEGKILAEIGSASRIDHAFEQGKAVGTSRQRIQRMLAEELQRSVSDTHLLQRATPDHQESRAGVTHAREAVDDFDLIGIVDLEHVVQCGRRDLRPARLHHPHRLVPVDALDRIDAGYHVGAGFDQPEDLLGLKADIRIDEQKMCRGGIVEKLGHEIGAGARDQRVAVPQQHLERHVRDRMDRPLQAEDRCGVDAGDLSAEARRGHHQVDLVGHERLRKRWQRPRIPHQTVNRRG